MNRHVLLLSITCLIILFSVTCPAEEAVVPVGKVKLFDGQGFDGLFRYLRNGQGDVDKTWQVKPGGVLACTGKPAGYIRTTTAYKNYKVRFEYRWPARPGNNGILVHAQGPDRVWPKCLECQGGFHNQGDFWEIGGFEFNEHTSAGHRVRGRRVLKYGEHNEKEAGQWNSYDIVCDGKTVTLTVNGQIQNQCTDADPWSGPICLQSEGSPIEFRNITLEPLPK